MNHPELATRQNRGGETTPYIITDSDEGFRVYAASDPKRRFLVSGTPQAPTCTCMPADEQSNDPEQYCEHILAVLSERSVIDSGNGAASYEDEERRAIQEEGRMSADSRRAVAAPVSPTPTTMLLKRSASPDGRIDSLSVEFSCAIDSLTPDKVKDKARRLLVLQSGIIAGFMQANPARRSNGNGGDTRSSQRPAEQNGGAPVSAQLVDVGGMDGKWGRRMFINVNIDGRTVRFFGTRNQLADALSASGYDDLASELEEGLTLDVPCRVTTKPSPDGRYLNVTKVLPPSASQRAKRAWS